MPEAPLFTPSFWARGPGLQTSLAQRPFRLWGKRAVVAAERDEVVRLAHSINVPALYSAVRGGDLMLGLVVMLPPWEGHARSTVMVRTAETLYRGGFEVYRLTYPEAFDPGAGELLDLIAETLHRVVTAIRTRPVLLVGFSLGANLALNLACRGLPGLKGVFGVSPALDAAKVRWPAHAARYVPQPDALKQLAVPAHLIASMDDPVVGAPNVEAFAGIERLTLHVQARGGHLGFLKTLWGPAWYEGRLLELMREVLKPRPMLRSTGIAEAAPLP